MVCEPVHFSSLIPLMVAPVVIISACGLLCLAFYNRYSFLVARLRGFQKESIELAMKKEKGKKKLLDHLHQQIELLFKRAYSLRFCLLFLILAIFSEVSSCLIIGFNLLYGVAESFVLLFFFLGLFLMLIALLGAMRELFLSLHPVRVEQRFVKKLSSESSEE